MSGVFVFLGPTLPVAEARQVLDARYLPPVAQGDVARLLWREPDAVVIIDGAFGRVPAVWHKEILFAMEQGVWVFGAASMGALRAAELAAFGMQGVGTIFDQYASGALEDDDEVAVAHAGAEAGYRRLSEAMVDIRATLRRAVGAGVLGASSARSIEDLAKGLYYPDRSYPWIVAQARAQGVDQASLDALVGWLPGGAVEVKRADALAVLAAVGARAEEGWTPRLVDYSTERTGALMALLDGFAPLEPWTPEGPESAADRVLAELKLDLPRYEAARRAALLRHLVVQAADDADTALGRDELRNAADDFRSARGLGPVTELERWLETNGITRRRLAALVREEVLVDRAMRGLDAAPSRRLFDELRATGAFGVLAERARRKDLALSAAGLLDASLTDVGIDEGRLFSWYCSGQQRTTDLATPEDIDAWLRASPFRSRAEARRTLLREFCYVTRCLGMSVQGAPEDRSSTAGGAQS